MVNKVVINKASSPKVVIGDLQRSVVLNATSHNDTATTTTHVEDSRQRHSGMTTLFNGLAFTLIELLVVVLIIGILAAVAVPQYQMAVEKARAAEAFSVLKTLRNAQEVYFLANGQYATDFETLDVSAPTSNTFDYNMDGMSVFAMNKNQPYTISFRFQNAQQAGLDSIVCYATNDAGLEKAKKICKHLGADTSSGTRWKISL